jgi:phosphate acetyltransferase
VIYPEGREERAIRAARWLRDRDLVLPVLIGPAAEVRGKAAALGVSLDGIELRDPATDSRRGAFEADYHELRKHKGVTPEVARDRVLLPHYFAALAVRAGEAAGFVSGLNSDTKPFLPAFEIVRMREGMKRASSVFVMAWEDRVYFYADCAMNIAPDAETLAEVGRATAASARAFGHEPRVAFLSFSTRDSAQDASVDRVKQAVALVRKAEPGLLVDGEMQFDAAIVPEVAGKKCPGSPLAGRANVFVFPDTTPGTSPTRSPSGSGERGPSAPSSRDSESRSTTSRGDARSRTSRTSPPSRRCRRWGRTAGGGATRVRTAGRPTWLGL